VGVFLEQLSIKSQMLRDFFHYKLETDTDTDRKSNLLC